MQTPTLSLPPLCAMEAPGGPWLIFCCPSRWLKRTEQCQVAFGEQMSDLLPTSLQSRDSEKSCGGWSIAHSCLFIWCCLTCHRVTEKKKRVKCPRGWVFHLILGTLTKQYHPCHLDWDHLTHEALLGCRREVQNSGLTMRGMKLHFHHLGS